MLYSSADGLLGGTLRFIGEGLAGNEAILVALPKRSLELVRGAVGAAVEGVRFAEMEEVGRNPARIIPLWQEFVDANVRAGRPMRGIGEPIWAERSAAELDECVRHEALLNVAFDDGPAWSLLCPYDTASLDTALVESAERNHRHLNLCGCDSPSTSFEALRDPFRGELEEPAAILDELPVELTGLQRLRRAVRAAAARAGLSEERAQDLVLAADEIATNSLQHAAGPRSLRIWQEDGALLCEVRDGGGRIGDPLIGRRKPSLHGRGGRGMWIANCVCDLVQIRCADERTVVRLHMAIHR